MRTKNKPRGVCTIDLHVHFDRTEPQFVFLSDLQIKVAPHSDDDRYYVKIAVSAPQDDGKTDVTIKRAFPSRKILLDWLNDNAPMSVIYALGEDSIHMNSVYAAFTEWIASLRGFTFENKIEEIRKNCSQ